MDKENNVNKEHDTDKKNNTDSIYDILDTGNFPLFGCIATVIICFICAWIASLL